MSLVTNLIAVFYLAVLCHAKEWTPVEMLIPEQNLEACNLDAAQEQSPRYMVCDPDKVLRRSHANTVNWLVSDVAKNSKTDMANSKTCPCSNHFCEVNRKNGFTGYHIGVALVEKMKLEDDVITGKTNNPRDQAMLFARTLEREKWSFGNCEEDIIIFFSKDDQELAIHVGKTAATRLNSEARLRLMRHSNHFFAEGKIIEGLNTLIVNMRGLLECPFDNINNCELQNVKVSGAKFVSASFAAVMASVMVTIYSML